MTSEPFARLHDDDRIVDAGLAARLLARQFPALADAGPLRPVTGGTDNAIWQAGTILLRFPRTPGAGRNVRVEAGWLPRLTDLPLAVPEVVGLGEPDGSYPYPWLVLRRLDGEDAATLPPEDDEAAGRTLAAFVAALRARAAAGAPPMPESGRLAPRDVFTRQMIARFPAKERSAVGALWDRALTLPEWKGTGVLLHRDLHPLNLLTRGGRLAAVIDWGSLCAGDPAHDLICAWTVLGERGRSAFRRALDPDPAEWARGRALAASKAIMAIPYYSRTNPRFAAAMRRTLGHVMSDER